MTNTQQELIGANLLLQSIVHYGGNQLFGCLGEGLLPVMDQLENHSDINYIHLQHEEAAVHAADGFARASGNAGFVLIGAGSAVTNAVTGLATAFSDSVPLVLIVCQIAKERLGKDSFQEVDVSGLTIPITKHYRRVANLVDLASIIKNAKHIAEDGRPGPVVVELGAELLTKTVKDENDLYSKPEEKAINQKKGTLNEISKNSIMEACSALSNANKPILLVGGGVIISNATDSLKNFVERTNIPVVSTLMGIGAFDSNSKLHLGMLGMHGTFAANKSVHHCDVLLCLGVRFSDRVTGKMSGFSPQSTKIQVDIDESEINKIVNVDISIVGDINDFLSELSKQLDYQQVANNCTKWVDEVTHYKKTVPRFDKSKSVLKPQEILQLIDQYSHKDSIVVTDVGQHQIFTAHHYKFTNPRTFLSSGGLGTMGYGFPAAIGAAVADRSKEIICVTGDGSFQMNLQELISVIKLQLPIKIIVLNNGYLGMVRQWQELFYNRRYSSVKISSPDFVKLAEAYGIKGFKANTTDEAIDIIKNGFSCDGPVLLEFNIVEEENVFPMVPPGASNEKVLLSNH